MRLIEQVRAVCNRLAPLGWRDLMLQHGLDITAVDLEQELIKDLPNINRQVAGFEDFASDGKRAIQAGFPSHSLLFHALASYNVVTGLQGFPTLVELEAVENYVYGVQPPSIFDLRARIGRRPLAIVVFASEYRPAPATVHRQHADMCFSRTGVARVGTAQPLYDAAKRSFTPIVDGEQNTFRTLPARYSAYIAVQYRGNQNVFGPMRFQIADNNLNFWIPLHKLFEGTECIRGLDLELTFNAHHVNENLANVNEVVKKGGYEVPHYIDFTGDGWVEALCPQLAVDIPRNIRAYSLVTSPNCNQGTPLGLAQQNIWQIPAQSLADERLAPNLQIKGANFRPEDKTVTAIVALPLNRSETHHSPDVQQTKRYTYLPDGTIPGCDVSRDTFNNVEHLAISGLNSLSDLSGSSLLNSALIPQ